MAKVYYIPCIPFIEHHRNGIATFFLGTKEDHEYVTGKPVPHYPLPVLYDDREMYRRFGAWFIDWSRGKLERY